MQVLNTLEAAGSVWLVAEWTIRIGALFVVPRNRKPSSGTAWLLLIFLVPFIGALLFLILGSPKLPETRRNAQKKLDVFITSTLKQLRSGKQTRKFLEVTVPAKYQPIATLNDSLSHLPVFAGNAAEVLPEYADVFSRLVTDIDAAERFVHLEYFIIAMDEATLPVFDAISRATARGVTVRVLYDWLSIRRFPNRKEMLQRLQADGVEVQGMLKVYPPGKKYTRPDLRNHRKLVVVDGVIAYTGSLNLIRRDYHRKDDIFYDELVMRVKGPIALQFAAVFMSDWYAETGKLLPTQTMQQLIANIKAYGDASMQVLPSGPGYEDENNLKLFTSLIHAAQKRIVITNPYFVPEEALMTAITTAAKRGVEVVMINSEAIDQWMVAHAQRSYYEDLLKAGVKIHLYDAPVLLHSKFMTIDGEVAAVGSSNLDVRSFWLNLEVTLVAYDPALTRKLNRLEAKYLAKSTEISLEEWLRRPRRKQLLDNIARLTAALQ